MISSWKPQVFQMINSSLGHYRIISSLGAGGMGEVYLAEDESLHRKVALKVIRADLARNEVRLQRFKQEAQAASALNHPNIITIYEIGAAGEDSYIAAEFIDGVTLRDRMVNGPLKTPEVLEIAIQISGALAEAHSAGIVHRDIKPENIMLRRDGYVKVVDFGLAKLLERQHTPADHEALTRALVETDAGMLLGTALYMSPEQAEGKAVDSRTDIWSLGVMLYEIVAGRAPFAGETPANVIARVLERDPVPLINYAPRLPAEFHRIISKAIVKNREERYQNVRDMLLDLKALKREMEFAARLERSPRSLDAVTQSGGGIGSNAANGSLVPTFEGPARATAAPADANRTDTLSLFTTIPRAGVAAAVLILLVMAVLAIGYVLVYQKPKSIDSIAVLPFSNQNRDVDTEYLSDGLTESIINNLAQLQSLRVIARSSVFRYKGQDVDPIAVGHGLGVRAVLTGRVVQHGSTLVVSAELMDVKQNKQLWGDHYEEDALNVQNLQRQISTRIFNVLKLKLTGAEQDRVSKRDTEDPEAYQLYLKGRFYWNKRTGQGFTRSIEYFNQAIERDPHFALAYAGLADAYVLLPNYSAASPRDSYPKAEADARRALRLDDTLAEAHTSLGGALFDYDWNLTESTREYQRAIELNPNYATAYHWYSWNLLEMGQADAAIASMRQAQQVDPLSLIINTDLGTVYTFARRYNEAIDQLKKTIDLDPAFYYAHYSLGIAYEAKGSNEEAASEFQKAEELEKDPYVLALMGQCQAAQGKREEALKTLDNLTQAARQQYVSPYSFAIIYAGLGKPDEAFTRLDQAYEERAADMTNLKFDPLLDSLRADPRFPELVRKVGL